MGHGGKLLLLLPSPAANGGASTASVAAAAGADATAAAAAAAATALARCALKTWMVLLTARPVAPGVAVITRRYRPGARPWQRVLPPPLASSRTRAGLHVMPLVAASCCVAARGENVTCLRAPAGPSLTATLTLPWPDTSSVPPSTIIRESSTRDGGGGGCGGRGGGGAGGGGG